MGESLTVACVYRQGNGFIDEYVYRLRDAVTKHCAAPHRFVCLTNHKLVGIETIPFARGKQLNGWWLKLELFRAGLFAGPVVYFDLDTLILGDITDIVTDSYGFACLSNWKGGGTHISSAIMAWDGTEDLSHLHTTFDKKMVPQYEKSWERWGDQGYIQDYLGRPWTSMLTRFPGRIVHYKTHCRGKNKEFPGGAPRGSSIVCFSGQPRPHELNWSLPFRAD